jgi:hypothetical protein
MITRRVLFLSIFAFAAVAHFAAAEPNETAIVSRIPREHVTSTAISSVGYSKRLHALEIEFRNGAIYRYLSVPMSVYQDLMAAESKARFYDQHVRGRYRSIHVRPQEAQPDSR